MQHPYEKTHAWITFEADLRRASAKFWMKLGEAQSKCDHIAGVALKPEVANQLHRLFLVKGVVGTTAIEGNTLTEDQVDEQIDGKLQLPASQEYLRQEVQNILEACNTIGNRLITGGSPNLSTDLIKEFNAMVLKGLTLEEGVVPGEIRQHSVTVGRYRGAPWEDCEHLLDRLCKWLNEFDEPGYPRVAIALIKASLAHLYIAWIHPFADGNGRTARLAEFSILLGAGVATPAAHLLSNHYNETRQQYYQQLDAARREQACVLSFLEYAANGFVDGLMEQLAIIRAYQWNLAWQDYLMDVFKDRHKGPEQRRYQLILELSNHEKVPVSKIKELSVRLAQLYSSLVPKTVNRDIAALQELDLVQVEHDLVRAKKEKVIQFLPTRRVTSIDDFSAFLPAKALRAISEQLKLKP